MEFVFGAASDAVDVELNAGAFPAGRQRVDAAGQDAFVAAGAGAAGSFGLLVAVAADSAVGPPDRDLVVFAAASAGFLIVSSSFGSTVTV
ncbi:hypothetical protein ABIB49_003495 [Arthrobacter sp. UYCu512]|uniref:hypothetical protein n=1 Tax=Arthrobacter sp. UYCu512 TaxID=3156338 RepID=UPI0033913B84